MKNSIPELIKALRDAATEIESASKFRLSEDIDLSNAVTLIKSLRPKNTDASLKIEINISSSKNEDVEVNYEIYESYQKKAESNSFKACLESYAASKESADSLGAISRLVKNAVKIDAESTQTAVEPIAVAAETF